VSLRAALAKRVGAFAVVVAAVLVVAAVAPGLVLPESNIEEGPDHPAWETEGLVADRLDATGEPDPDGNVGTVVFDRTHRNRFDREDVGALTGAITDAGGDVRFSDTSAEFQSLLDTADVLVVVDPAQEFDAEEVDALERFVREGGRLVVFGEPNRRAIATSGLGASLVTRRSQLTNLASAFGLSFGTEYLYDMEENDGNFKSVVTGPTDRTDSALVDGVEQVALPTAASVSVNNGDVLLRTAPSAETAGRSTQRGYPVAVTTNRGKVLAVGDASFLGGTTAAVGDNDVFIERIVEFMAAA